MQQQTDGNDELVRLARRAGIYAGIFLAGGLLTFGYSYSPLHDAKNWRIDYLEERIRAKDAQLDELQKQLDEVRSEAADKPDGETFKLLQQELVTADKTVQELERKLARAEKQAKELERSRDKWKARHAEAESRRQPLAASAPAAEPAPATAAAETAAPDSAPAAPAPGAPATPADGGA